MNAARTWWKAYYRLQRIARREGHKAWLDVMLHGTGVIFHGDDGSIKHVPLSNLFISDDKNRS